MFDGRVGFCGPVLGADTKRKLDVAFSYLVGKQSVELGDGKAVQAHKTPYGDFRLHLFCSEHWNHFFISASGEIKQQFWTDKSPDFFEVRKDGLYARERLSCVATPVLDFNTFIEKLLSHVSGELGSEKSKPDLKEVPLPKSDERRA